MYKRILLKLSGESLMGTQSHGIDPQRLQEYAQQIKAVHEMGVQIGIVIGGGNFFRGLSGAQKGFDRVKGDQMGMCARWYLYGRPRERSNGHKVHRNNLRRDLYTWIEGDGPHRNYDVQGEQLAHLRV